MRISCSVTLTPLTLKDTIAFNLVELAASFKRKDLTHLHSFLSTNNAFYAIENMKTNYFSTILLLSMPCTKSLVPAF